MSINDSITGLANVTLTVSRRAQGNYVHGIYTPASASSFPISAVMQPAFNLNRIIGGSDLKADVDNQKVETIYQIHTTTPLISREQSSDPDVVTYAGTKFIPGDYTVARAEVWDIDGETHCHAVITKQTRGAA